MAAAAAAAAPTGEAQGVAQGAPGAPRPLLGLTKVWSLDDDVRPCLEAAGTAASTGDMMLLGQEGDGTLLIVRDVDEDNAKRTLIEAYDPRSRTLTTLYRHETPINCVSCSVNVDKTLLGFTTLKKYRPRRNSEEPEAEDIYESFLVEIQPQGKCYSLNVRSREFQRIQFLNQEAGRKNIHFLFILDTEFIHLYVLSMGRRATGAGSKIVAQPNLQSMIVKHFFWYEWDMRRNMLYVIPAKAGSDRDIASPAMSSSSGSLGSSSPSLGGGGDTGAGAGGGGGGGSGDAGASGQAGGGGSGTSSGEHTLRCYSFNDRRQELRFEFPVSLKLRRLRAPKTPIRNLWMKGYASPNVQMHVVRLRGNALCLCLQEFVQSSSRATPEFEVTVLMLHRKSKLTFRFPVPVAHTPELENTHLHFSSIADMLLVYMPGHYIRFIDCGTDHEPCDSLTFSGSEFATLLPGQADDGSTVVVTPFDLHYRMVETLPAFPDLRGKMLLDCARGIIYEYTIEREALIALFRMPKPREHIQAMHMAAIHLQDFELVDKIIMLLAGSHPDNITPELLKEFLVGCPCQVVRDKRMEPHLMRLLPVTTLPSYLSIHISDQANKRRSSKFQFAPLAASWRAEFLEVPPRFSVDRMRRPSVESAPQSPANPKFPVVRSIFAKLFGPIAADRPEARSESEQEDATGPLSRWQFVDLLTDYFVAQNPREARSKSMRWAQEYANGQSEQAGHLYESICRAVGGQQVLEGDVFKVVLLEPDPQIDTQRLLDLLFDCYSAFEDLGFPLPRGFVPLLTLLGYKHLPEHVFVQYCERGIFRLSDPFIEVALSRLQAEGDDGPGEAFKHWLLNHVSKPEVFVMLLIEHAQTPPEDRRLVEFLVNAIMSSVPSDIDISVDDEDDGDKLDTDIFQPLAVFLHEFRVVAEASLAYHKGLAGSPEQADADHSRPRFTFAESEIGLIMAKALRIERYTK